MPTLNQICRSKRKKTKKYSRVSKLESSPQKKGMCLSVRNVKPKKPNSAIRKIVQIAKPDGSRLFASIPGQGHNLQKYSVVLFRGGRIRDVPGVRYRLVKGKYDFGKTENFLRTRSLSKYGMRDLTRFQGGSRRGK